MKIGICFLTSKIHPNNISGYVYNQLSNIFKDNDKYDLYTLLEVENISDNTTIDSNTITFTFNNLRKKYNIEQIYYLNFRGVCHMPLFYLYELHPEYDYYIFYEDDLLYTGMDNPFDKIQFENYDIMFTYDRKYNPNWYWVNVAHKICNGWIGYEGLLNSYIISNKALSDLKNFCTCNKWYGHHELMINSFFYNQKDKYKIGLYNDYIPTYIEWKESTVMNRLLTKSISSKDFFIHPIKSFNTLSVVNDIINRPDLPPSEL